MTSIERHALYHLLRMNWLNEPNLPVESWQVEDYRALSLSELFERLHRYEIFLERTSFIAYADECDSPEDLTDQLLADQNLKPIQEDRAYLAIFEIWRRLMREKPSLSIVCNDLDHQIYLYDHNLLKDPAALQEALIHFSEMLDANVDQGIPPQEVIKLISNHCANDIEVFLYDFITEQIEEGNETYVHELLEDFNPYFIDNKWFKLLRLRLSGYNNGHAAQRLAEQIIEDHLNEQDLEYNLELLDVFVSMRNHSFFHLLAKKTLPLLETEENFQDFLHIAMDYFQVMDQKSKASTLQNVLNSRQSYSLDTKISEQDPDRQNIIHYFN